MSAAPLILLVVVMLVLFVVQSRAKTKRAAQEAQRRESMTVGSAVMTTSGLYGTVTAFDPANDGTSADTVVIAVAPGVEVRWALVAVKEAPVRAGAAAAGTAVTPGTTDGTGVDAVTRAGAAGPAVDGTPRVSVTKPKAR